MDNIDDEKVKEIISNHSGQNMYSELEKSHSSDSIKMVRTHESDNKGNLTLVGVLHDGHTSRKVVRDVINSKKPDYVGVELGPVESFSSKLFGRRKSKSELTMAIHEARNVSAQPVSIDRSQIALAFRSIRHNSLFLRAMSVQVISMYLLISALVLSNLITALTYDVIDGLLTIFLILTALLLISYPITVRNVETDYGRLILKKFKRNNGTDEYNEELQDFFESTLGEWRNEYMYDNIERLRQDGDVVAVVGFAHMDGIQKRVDSSDGNWEFEESFYTENRRY